MNNSLLESNIYVYEVGGVYEEYTGRRFGYTWKANVEAFSSRDGTILVEFVIAAKEIQKNSPEMNIEVTYKSKPLGIKVSERFLHPDNFNEGGLLMGEDIVRRVLGEYNGSEVIKTALESVLAEKAVY